MKNLPINQIIGSIDKELMKRNKVHDEICLISQVERKTTNEACKYKSRINKMQEELYQIEKNNT